MDNIENIRNDFLGEMPSRIFFAIRDYFEVSPHRLHSFLGSLQGMFAIANYMNIDATQMISELNGRGMTIGQFAEHAATMQDLELMRIVGLPVHVSVENLRQDLYIGEGQRFRLDLRVTGHPFPNFQWRHNGHPIHGATQISCTFESARSQDMGLYDCHCTLEDGSELITQPTNVRVYRLAPLLIKVQPRRNRTEIGKSVVFVCEASEANVTYQWYKDDIPLQDSEGNCDVQTQLRGCQSTDLRLHNIDSFSWQGCYHCEVRRGNERIYSVGAPLQVVNQEQIHLNPSNYTATDKVALLIGCSDYRGTSGLSAPRYDVLTLAEAFESLNFKVVSLLDLSKQELMGAIHQFQPLVEEGVYCVFYFCGHGFESANNGFDSHCFLVPVDAPTGYDQRDCVSARQVFSMLLEKKPAICCMILDICRKNPTGATSITIPSLHQASRSYLPSGGESMDRSVDFYSGCDGAGNSIVCYGTCSGLAAYEDKTYGIFVHHLKNFLTLPISIERVFERLREALGQDPKVHTDKRLQVAEVKSSLIQVGRSFSDPIDYRGHTSQFNRHQHIWERANKKPDAMSFDIEFEGFNIPILLTFGQEFSNVLQIFVTVEDPGLAQVCIAYVSQVPMGLAQEAENKRIISRVDSRIHNTFVAIKHIQKLREANMRIKVTAICIMPDGNQLSATSDCIDLPRPLVANLEL